MLKQMKKTIGILLAVCFLISVTAATVSAHGPVMVKEKKTAIIILKDVKTKIYKWPHHHHHHHKMHHHHHKMHHHHKLMKAVKEFMKSWKLYNISNSIVYKPIKNRWIFGNGYIDAFKNMIIYVAKSTSNKMNNIILTNKYCIHHELQLIDKLIYVVCNYRELFLWFFFFEEFHPNLSCWFLYLILFFSYRSLFYGFNDSLHYP